MKEFEKISKEAEKLVEAINRFVSWYKMDKKSEKALYDSSDEDFYDDRLNIISSFNTLEMSIRETFGFFPSSLNDLMKVREEFQKLKPEMKKREVFEFREHAFSFFDRTIKALKTENPVNVLVKEITYDDIKKSFMSAMGKLSKEASVMSALSYLCSTQKFVSAKELASVLNINIKTATKAMDTISHYLWQFIEYQNIGKEVNIRAKSILIRLYKEVG